MINHELLKAEGILILAPEAPLESTDFEGLAREIDPFIETNGKLHGVMIDAKSFPGWKDFAAMVAHLKFVKNHHQKIQKLAIVTDSSVLTFRRKSPVISFRPKSSILAARRGKRHSTGLREITSRPDGEANDGKT